MAIAAKEYFFWTKGLGQVVFPFWWLLVMLLVLYPPFLRPWWWIFFPLFLSLELKTLYLWWIEWDYAYSKVKWVILEVVPPRESLVPIKAMEDVFSTMWGPLFDGPNFRELYCEGMLPDCPNWMSLEITSIEGKLHFFVRLNAAHRTAFETALYSYYPELEIHEVKDFLKDLPRNIPNDEWDLSGEEFILKKPAPFPIKTYEEFFEPQGEKISAEEKRIDPLNSLLESMSRLGEGEYYWAQIIISSSGAKSYNPELGSQADAVIGKLTKRPVKTEKTIGDEIADILRHLILGPTKEGSGEKATYEWYETQAKSESGEREMLLTPGEREQLTKVENKIKKPIFRTVLRGVYVAKRENWRAANKVLFRTYTGHFNTENLNSLSLESGTRTKVHYFFRKRRVFLRSRRMFNNSLLRFPGYFPNRKSGCALLTAEELASIFHFPVKMSGMIMPTMEKIEAKKSGPPPNLPT